MFWASAGAENCKAVLKSVSPPQRAGELLLLILINQCSINKAGQKAHFRVPFDPFALSYCDSGEFFVPMFPFFIFVLFGVSCLNKIKKPSP